MHRKLIHHAMMQCNTFSWEVDDRNPAADLKLMCIMYLYNRVEVPSDEVIAQVFQDALRFNQPCSEHWAVTSSLDCISMHMSCEMVLSNTHKQLLFLQGKVCTDKRQHFSRDVWQWFEQLNVLYGEIHFTIRLIGLCILFLFLFFYGFPVGVTLDEMCVISMAHSNAVPVCSDDGRMRLLDFSAPFLFCRDRRYYGSELMIMIWQFFSRITQLLV